MVSRIGIIGDVHAEDHHLDLAIRHLLDAGVDTMVCTGDIVDGVGNVARCCELLEAHGVHTVRGNHDRWLLQGKVRHVPNAHLPEDLDDASLAFLERLPTQISLETPHGRLLLCHGVADNDLKKVWPGTERMPIERSTQLDEIIASGEYDYMINGHVHYRTMINFHSLTLFNAGTLKGDHRPGFSILDCSRDHITGYEFQPMPRRVQRLTVNDPSQRAFTNTRAFDGAWRPVTLYGS